MLQRPAMTTLARSPLLAAMLATAAALSACSSDDDASSGAAASVKEARSALKHDTAPNVASAEIAEVTRGDAAFGLDVYKQLVTGGSKDTNLFFSGHSVSRAFAMLWGGARGTTAADIAKTFHFTLPPEKVHAAMNRVALDLASRSADGGAGSDGKGFRLALNNSFWGEQTTKWESPYLDLLAVNYDAGIKLVDFAGAAESARTKINLWTEEKTEKRIKDLLPTGSLDQSTRFVLVNTVYFNAAWASEFVPTTSPFASPGGSSNVPAIQQTSDEFRHAATDDAEAVAIPYEGNKLEMIVVVPKELEAFEAKLDGALFESITGALAPANVDLTMPKLKIEGETISLKEQLSALGLSNIFGGGDFTGMSTSTPLTIDDVYHQAFVKIDEKGTEAAAATAIVGRETSAPVDPPKKVVVDKPYLFFIRDVPTGAVLFTGRVVAPSFSQ